MKCYLHLGVHKTATSSLQKNVLETLPEQYAYLGVRYPRATRQWPLYTSLIHAVCRAGVDEFLHDAPALREQLEAAGREVSGDEASGGVVISDELLSTGGEEFFGGQTTVRERLQRLGHLLAGFELRVLVTIRRQPDAIYSLFVQKYNYLPSRYRVFETFYQASDLLAYDYAAYAEAIAEDLGTRAIFLADFHDIRSGRYLATVARWLERDAVATQSLTQEKKREKRGGGVEIDRVSLGYRLKRLLPTGLVHLLARSRLGQAALKPLYRRLERVKTSRTTTLPALSPDMAARIDRDFEASNRRLHDRYDIRWHS
ncbi:hypothetical protein [Salinicola avicenniae]|uniref:hypothetical protein n=1 Tax=Salinicola avicenniae TaxID=2916836 RepID=UPI002073AFC8|nr:MULTISPECIES: hypothetical protein [unclassified Salinicola]